MGAPFPLTPTPAYYTQVTPAAAHGIWYVGDTPSMTLNKSGATGYSVRDYYGNVVASGSVSGTTVTPATPSGGWKPGWYRLYLTGASTDSVFGPAYGSSTFVILRPDSRFPTAVTGGLQGSSPRDLRTKAALGMGTSRLEIDSLGSPDYTGLHADTDLSNTYWTVSTGSYTDSARTRQMWCNFPGDTSTNLSAVTSVVADLYARGVTRFEGPSNEPSLNAALVSKMQQFYNAVKAGNANAVVLGPCPVSIDANDGGGLEQFLAAGGGAYIDEWAVHAYNSQTNGDLSIARAQWGAFKAMLAKYGQAAKPVWQTESTHTFHSVYGVYHPRRARVSLLQTLYLEQIGIPRERNSWWYDVSHGFWSYPSWWQQGAGTLEPAVVLHRVLAEETFGKTHAAALTFGTIGDRVFIGSRYDGASGSVIVAQAQSSIPGSSITFTVTGAASVVVVDGFGSSSTVAVSGGLAQMPVGEVPSYLRLPSGVTATVHHCNDWPSKTAGWLSGSHAAYPTLTNGSPVPLVNDRQWAFRYSGAPVYDGYYVGTSLPETVTLTWPTATRLDRVLFWGGVWQSMTALLDFDVQTSVDGATWVTQATVTKASPTSFAFGSDSNGTGCQYETYWDEQWIFDVKLPTTVTAKAVRLVVRSTSYGGEPDAQALSAGGQGSNQHLTLQEFVTVCDDNANISRYVRT